MDDNYKNKILATSATILSGIISSIGAQRYNWENDTWIKVSIEQAKKLVAEINK